MAIPKRLIGVQSLQVSLSGKNEDVMERGRPIKTMIGLAFGFLFITGVAFWTVLLPEIEGGADEDGTTESVEEATPEAEAEAAPAP